ncbi:class I SAM-dependent methyltransferase [Ascidiimonas sp. W6]|uniref:class I SAM-dependent methyltransferase n=1 Tax=Ascidiimonas meishanensis TaxID=3128903 RepID=UPI0030EF19EA
MPYNSLEKIKKLNNPAHLRFEQVRCYVCGSHKYDEFLIGEEDLTGKEGEFLYVKCQDCSLVYQNPRIGIDGIKEYYDGEYIAHRKKKDWGLLTPLYEWAMNKHDRDKSKIVKKFVPLSSKTNTLDVGCAVGTFLLHIHKEYGCAISGVDFKGGFDFPDFEKIDFHEGLFYDQDFKGNSFDLITMWHFLEHCYDPNLSLQKAHKVLEKDGRLIIEVPRLDSFTFKLFKNKWPGVQAPQHTAMYDKKSLIRLLQQNGFEIEAYLPYGAFPDYFYLFTGTYFKLFGKGLNLNNTIFPYFLGQLLLTPVLWFYKSLNLSMQTVVCKKF